MEQSLTMQVTEKDVVAWLKKCNFSAVLQKKRLELWNSIPSLPSPQMKYSLGVGSILSQLDCNSLPATPSSVLIEGEGAAVTKGSEAFEKKELFSVFNPEENKFTALHGALVSSLTVIEIPEGKELDSPIVITTKVAEEWCSDHVLIIAKPNSRAIIIDRTDSDNANPESSNNGWRTQGIEIIVESGATLTFASLQTLPKQVNQIAFHHARIEKDATLNWIEGNFGATELFSTTRTDLVGQGSSVTMQSIFFGCGHQKYDLQGVINHRSPLSTSNLIAKGVLKDYAKSIYRGLIKIHKNADGCKGLQQEDTLLLSNTSEADALPVLEIDNNDVVCNHSATVGKLDPELLFYMGSRGIPEDEAKRLLVLAFFTPILDKLHHKKIEENMLCIVEERLL